MADKQLPKVSLIVLSWNGGNDLKTCTCCCVEQTYANCEIIVVDNGSSDGSLEQVEAIYPDIRLIRNGRNLGFASGMNIGISRSTGDYVVPLNQDAFLSPTFVAQLVEAMEKDPGAGASSSTVEVTQGNASESIIAVELGYALHKHMRGYIVSDRKELASSLGPPGCCPFFRRVMLEEVALQPGEYFDATYVTGGEDIDLYIRMQLQGWHCLHVPEATAQHIGSGSVGRKLKLVEKPFWYQRQLLRNRYLTILSDLPIVVLLRISLYILCFELAVIPYLLVTSPITLRALCCSWCDTLSLAGYIIRKRQLLSSRKVLSAGQFMSFFLAP